MLRQAGDRWLAQRSTAGDSAPTEELPLRESASASVVAPIGGASPDRLWIGILIAFVLVTCAGSSLLAVIAYLLLRK